ncbi:efflux RND transporter periplasmic adaptor subunit [Altererythrobacter fulvus]|uniref:efflux RND transporter periplasmic adaptor subunit n=1 Tax=Caenibius fulvus TaxID=2126012 RepID=UPI00301B2F25
MNYETTVDASSRAALSGQDAEEAARRRKLIIIAVVVALVLAIGAVVLTRGGGSESTGQQATQTPAVTVIAPGQATVQGAIQATGTLAARREMPIGVVGEGGRVVSVPVEAGQWVRAGQILAVIDRSVQTQQTASSAANIEVARADARLAQANLDRALQLVDRGFISKADIDRLTATRDAAVARVRVAEAQYGERNARNAQLNIVAPASGLLLTRNVEPGQVVSTGSGTLFSIAKDGQFELLALVGESELAKIAVGVSAQVTPVGTDKSFTGQVWQVAPVIDQQNRQGTARIALSYAPELRPGGFASATISSGTVVAPMLPESAILSDAEGSYVYIVGKGNKVERRGVKTGLVTENGIAVTEGLTGSEKVVLRAGGFLAPGDEVRPRVVTK